MTDICRGPCGAPRRERRQGGSDQQRGVRRHAVTEEWGKEVVATYKHFDKGFTNKGQVEDYERGGPAGIVTPYWLTDDSISSSSWCYTVGIGYYSTNALLHALIDRVSKSQGFEGEAKVAYFKDPDGNTLSIAQAPRS